MINRIPQNSVPVRSAIELRPVQSVSSPGVRRVPTYTSPAVMVQRLESLPPPTTQRITTPSIRQTPPPVTSSLRSPSIDTPGMDVIQYDPPVIKPEVDRNAGGANGGQNGGGNEEADETRELGMPDPPPIPEAPSIDVPFVGEVPVPPAEVVVLSGTTAVATVAATLIGKQVATQLLGWMKPVVKQAYLQGKKLLKKDLTPYEIQELMLFEGEKKLTKRLKKEQKQEKLRQASVHRAPLHQRIRMRMEKKDGNRPQP